jgi:hypothetical protein
MPTYKVHIYREMRIVYQDVQAPTPEAAAESGRDFPSDAGCDPVDCDGQTFAAVVDPLDAHGRHGRSQDILFEEGRLRLAAPQLLAACRMVVERWEHGDLAAAARACSAAVAEAERRSTEPPSGDCFVIHSAEADAYWSNDVGWTGPEEATAFTAAERSRLRLPIGGRWVAAQPYSVLLLYPDDVNDDGAETYYAWVEAPDPVAAVAEARRRALATNEWTEEDVDPDGFIPLLVIEGHHRGQPTSND